MSDSPVRYPDTLIVPASLDPKAVSVIQRLVEAGFPSYLVGGCVRDLLLGHLPKDFDVSTAARPRQIRRVFRNCRIIGRRFKLAHVHFGTQIVEVATFRRSPDLSQPEEGAPAEPDLADDEESESDDLLIVRDNVYGSEEEDARRRDFTMNALLYDVAKGEVIDWVGGVPDLQAMVVRTIGDPAVRLAEDPVRMLRAIKFSARLGLDLDPALAEAMRASASLIERSAPPRVLEEIYKLLTCGNAARALGMLLEFGLLAHLLPSVAAHWTSRPAQLTALGAALDHVDRGRRRLGNALLLAALSHDPWRAQLEQEAGADPQASARDLLGPAALAMNVPRRDQGRLRGLLTAQFRLERSAGQRRPRMADFLGRPAVQEAVDLLYLRALAGLADPEIHADWAAHMAEILGSEAPPQGVAEAAASRGEGGRRRRHRGGRRRRGGRDREPSRTRGAEPASSEPGTGGEAGPSLESPSDPARVGEPGVRPGNGADRKRRRRRRRGGARQPLAQDRTGSSGDASDAGSQGAAGAAATPATGEAGPAGRARRRRRRRGGARQAAPQGASPSDQAPAPGAPTGRASEGRGRGRRRTRSRDGESRAPRESREPRDDMAATPQRERNPSPDASPGQRHPEDVEDIFDW